MERKDDILDKKQETQTDYNTLLQKELAKVLTNGAKVTSFEMTSENITPISEHPTNGIEFEHDGIFPSENDISCQ